MLEIFPKMKQLQSPLLICLLFGFQAEILGQTGIDSLLRELKTLSNLKNVFLPPPDPMRPSLEFTSSQVTRPFFIDISRVIFVTVCTLFSGCQAASGSECPGHLCGQQPGGAQPHLDQAGGWRPRGHAAHCQQRGGDRGHGEGERPP